MWVAETWETEEDVEKDLILMAEYAVPTAEDLDPNINKIPDTIVQYKKQMAKNKEKTLNNDIDENATYVISGRGKGIRDRVIRPGGLVDSHPSDEIELKKQIREVAGFGYSNELIEQSIKARAKEPEVNTNFDARFKLVTSTSSSGKSSSESSPRTTPTKKKPRPNCTNSPNFMDKTDQFPPLK